MKLSVIIPTFNEEDNIGRLIHLLEQHADERLLEIIVCDGQSIDQTVSEAARSGATVLQAPRRGRAAQMNHAALQAKGEVLYFVHADTMPPASYLSDIEAALGEGHLLGGYGSEFISSNPLFRINAWLTRLNSSVSQGGDQTLFVDADLFSYLGGYDEAFVIMEDFDFIRRANVRASFKKMSGSASISTRKYARNSYLKVTLANALVFGMYKMGIGPQYLQQTYHKLLR